uniref:Uncharacterized protein n=1 Tax=Anguilla anguilla TaxID=7936 RepID=A0A0E9W7V8_ANGAN
MVKILLHTLSRVKNTVSWSFYLLFIHLSHIRVTLKTSSI